MAPVQPSTARERWIPPQCIARPSSRAIEHLIAGTLEGQGHRSPKLRNNDSLPTDYDPTLIHASADLTEVAAGLLRTRAGRLCLYGPPNRQDRLWPLAGAPTGHPVARQARIGPHVQMGRRQREEYGARAFRSAAEEGAVLFIDEVDGCLQDRRSAGARWEVSLVNELLLQMESFSGIFVASTNLVD